MTSLCSATHKNTKELTKYEASVALYAANRICLDGKKVTKKDAFFLRLRYEPALEKVYNIQDDFEFGIAWIENIRKELLAHCYNPKEALFGKEEFELYEKEHNI